MGGNQISDLSPLSGLTKLKTLYLFYNKISKISALSGLVNLSTLYISNNQISDLSPLSGLTKLKTLYLYSNKISKISALSGLVNLSYLHMGSNQISDISPLSTLSKLTYLYLKNNLISDIAPLKTLTQKYRLYISGNCIKSISMLPSTTTVIGFDQQKSSCPVTDKLTLVVSKSGSGLIKSSPAGINCGTDCREDYTKGTSVQLTATPDTGYTIKSWGGDCSGTTNNCTVTMSAKKSVSVSFIKSSTADVAFSFDTGSSTKLQLPMGVSKTLKLMLKTGTNKVSAFDLSLVFDKTRLKVEKMEMGTAFQTLTNQINEGTALLSGNVPVGSSDVAGNILVAKVTLKGLKKGDTDLQFKDLEVASGGTIYRSSGKTLQMTVINRVLKGKIAYPSSVVTKGWESSLSLLAANTVTKAILVNTKASPNQQGEFNALGLPSGDFLALVKGSHSLSRMKLVTVNDLSTGKVISFPTFCEGDASGDDRVSSIDFGILKNTYRLKKGDAKFDARADFTQDGIVRSSDFSLLKSCYRKQGDGYDIWRSKQSSKAIERTESADVVFIPKSFSVSASGQKFSIKVGLKVDQKATVDSFDLVLKTASLGTSVIRLDNVKNISPFETSLYDLKFNSKGDVSISLATFSKKLSGDIALLELEYTYLGGANSSTSIVIAQGTEITGKQDGKVADLTGKLSTIVIDLKEKYALDITKTGLGKVKSNPVGIDCGSDCSESYNKGTSVKLIATPATGYKIKAWSGACSGTTNSCTVTMSAKKSVAIHFEKKSSLPAKATLISPKGSISDSTPTYKWKEVSGASWYYLYVNGANGKKIRKWYKASQACSHGTCSVTPSTVLASGSGKWWIRTWNNAGYGGWSSTGVFVIE
jgi:hypothetical protein